MGTYRLATQAGDGRTGVVPAPVPHPTLNSCRGDAAAVGQFRFRQISGGVGMPLGPPASSGGRFKQGAAHRTPNSFAKYSCLSFYPDAPALTRSISDHKLITSARFVSKGDVCARRAVHLARCCFVHARWQFSARWRLRWGSAPP
jgi:hypothetical protein